MQREEAIKKMKTLYTKAQKARKEGKRGEAQAFRAGGQRLLRRIEKMPKPVEAKEAADE